jgi:LDH2 family malate/lactate/ureidoglycolate dehydrogenase
MDPEPAGAARFSPEDLLSFAQGALRALGVPADDACEVAGCLLEADLRGVSSHGLVRLPVYGRRIRAGVVNAVPAVRICCTSPATALVDGDNGLGAVAGCRGIKKAVELAGVFGIGIVGIRRSNHFGAASYYVRKAVERGFLGFACSNAPPNMAPYGGRQRFLGTNPFAVGIPLGGGMPLIFDASTSVVARGKIILAAHSGDPIPEGWAIDAQGRPTTNAQEALGGAVLPFGGPKGSAISFIIDVLCGVMTGAGFAKHLNTLEDLHTTQNLGHVVAALRSDVFLPAGAFAGRMREIIEMLKACPAALGVDRVLLPGEIEAEKELRSRRCGVALASEIVQQLMSLGAEVDVPFPNTLPQGMTDEY